MSHQVRIFAYLNNLLLMGSFLGMGLGVAAGRRKPGLFEWTLPSLAVLAAILAYSPELHLLRIPFPDPSFSLWGAETLQRGEHFLGSLAKMLALFALVVWIFACAGSIVGELFTSLDPLRAYTADLIGSLAGVIAMTIAAALGTTPPVWLGIACVALACLSRARASWIVAGLVVVLAQRSVQGARFSPYNRIDVGWSTRIPGHPLALAANRDAHQWMLDLSSRHITDSRFTPAQRRTLFVYRYLYDFPFAIAHSRGNALVVGAGTGNDVAAALRNGFGRVVSVDIDPVIIDIGKRAHPEHPYSDRRVVAVVNDARAYFEQQKEQFDVVCFGLLDSHAMFSSMSSLRLDNYVYTVEAMHSAWDHVAPGGVMTVTFSVAAGEWIADRITAILDEATGQTPRVFAFPATDAKTFVVTKGNVLPPPPGPFEVPPHIDQEMRIPHDDWPFLYLRPHVVPVGYLTVLVCVLAIATLGARLAFGPSLFRQGFDLPLFLMGAAFLLIETRGVTDLSLLFGSTWIVNSAVFGGVLLLALIANLIIARYRPRDATWIFVGLFVALMISYYTRPSTLLQWPILSRGVAGGVINALPVGFAGLIFSRLLARSGDAAASLGSNLLGALVGGCLEYFSIVTGLRFLTMMALALYGAAFVVSSRRRLLRDPA